MPRPATPANPVAVVLALLVFALVAVVGVGSMLGPRVSTYQPPPAPAPPPGPAAAPTPLYAPPSSAPRPPDGAEKSVHVRGYTRADGTYVAPYDRRPPRH